MSRCGARLKRGFSRSIADTRGLDIEARERFISRNRGPFPTGPSLHPFPLAHAHGDPFAAIRYRSDTRCISAATTFLLPLLARWKRMAVCGRVGRRGPVEWLKTISRPDAAMGTGSEKMIRNEWREMGYIRFYTFARTRDFETIRSVRVVNKGLMESMEEMRRRRGGN